MVLVATPTLDAANLAEETLGWLERNGYQHLVDTRSRCCVRPTSLGAACSRTSAPPAATAPARDLAGSYELRARFIERCRDVVEIPADPHLAQGRRITPAAMRPATRDAYLTLSAAVMDAAPSSRAH